jgi:hypothetical protein
MNEVVFKIVFSFLSFLVRITGFSYNQINIILYFFCIPFSWLLLLDIIFHFHYLKIAFLSYSIGFLFTCRNFKTFSDHLFYRSVSFLNYFNKYGSNYFKSSVFFCVLIPLIIYFILIYIIFK